MAYRMLFFGSATFSAPLLETLAQDKRFEVIGVVTQPDRPVGRKGELTPPPIKTTALNLGLPVFQYESVKPTEVIAELKEKQPDLIIVASFGQIMPQALLDVGKLGAINFHWSLLPKYRGASPIQGAIIEGEGKTGATIMLMDAKMDHGAILNQLEEKIEPTDTSDILYHRLSQKGAPLLADTIIGYIEKTITPKEQDHSQATFVKILTRENGKLDPVERTAEELERRVRAYQPWPGAYLELEGKRLKVLKTELGPPTSEPPSTLFNDKDLPCIACKQGTSLRLTEVQPEGKKPMKGQDFLRGQRKT